MENLIEIIPSFEIQLGKEINPDLFDQEIFFYKSKFLLRITAMLLR
jgi:hypothetical protein